MARRRPKFWTCTRQTKGVKCNTLVPVAKRKCPSCGKARPKKSPPKHMAALNNSYEHFIEINGGEHCGICGITREQTSTPNQRMQRDHVHTTTGLGEPRGLLCIACNIRLSDRMTVEWTRAALAYLERHEIRMAGLVIDETEAATTCPSCMGAGTQSRSQGEENRPVSDDRSSQP